MPYLVRSSGIVATVLIVLALAWGLLFSARATGNRRRPNWWLDLHNYLGGLALVFVVVHIVAAYLDSSSGIGVAQIFVPLTSTATRWGIAWGVLATDLLAVAVFTSWPKKLFARRTWLLIHLLSIPVTVVAAVHAWMVGSDQQTRWFQATLAVLLGVAVYPAVVRLNSVLAKRQQRRERAFASAGPPADQA